MNGSIDVDSYGVRAAYYSSTQEMSLISSTAVPGGSNNYEVKVQFTSPNAVVYLRASNDARYFGNIGTFYALTLQSGTLGLFKRVSNVTTQLASSAGSCGAGPCTIRAIIVGSVINVYLNGQWLISVTDSSIATGKPGIGSYDPNCCIGYGIRTADFGAIETTAPVPPSPNSVSSAVFPNRVDLQWQGATDGATGSGVWRYSISRNGTLLQYSPTSVFSDSTVAAGTAYTYTIVAHDYHGNSGNMTPLTVTTPAAGTTDPRRVGVAATGSYWGEAGERIDMRLQTLCADFFHHALHG